MTYKELADLIVKETKKRHKQKKFASVILKYKLQPITNEVIHELLNPLFKSVLSQVPEDTARWLARNFEEFVPDAIAHVQRNQHMNNARGKKILTQEWADAFLVGCANNACAPAVDLAMYVSSLYN